MFDIVTNDGKEHFALAVLIAACEARGESQQDGFVDESLLFEHLQELGYSIEQIEAHIARAIEGTLLQPSNAEPPLRSLRLTAAGSYMHKRMISIFTYVDAVIVDTPIVDPAVRQTVHDASQIQERLERAEVFRQYLDAQWLFGEARTTFSWPMASAELRRDIEGSAQRAERRRGSPLRYSP